LAKGKMESFPPCPFADFEVPMSQSPQQPPNISIDTSGGSSPGAPRGTKRRTRRRQTIPPSIWAPAAGALVVLLIIIVILLTRSEGTPSHAKKHPAVGQKFTQLVVQTLREEEPENVVWEDLQGSVVVLGIWGPAHEECRDEMKFLIGLDRKYGNRSDFKLLAIAYGNKGDDRVALLESTQEYLAGLGAEGFLAYRDRGNETLKALDEMGAFEGFPTTIILDRQGDIRGVWSGHREAYEREKEDMIARLLK